MSQALQSVSAPVSKFLSELMHAGSLHLHDPGALIFLKASVATRASLTMTMIPGVLIQVYFALEG